MKNRALVLLVFALEMTGGVALAAQPPPRAFTQVASCPTCEVRGIAQLRLRYSGVEAWATKLFNPQSNAIIPVTLMGDGIPVDQEKLKQDDYAARVTKYGKLSLGLGDRLDSVADTDSVDVTIWTNSKVQFPRREDLAGMGANKMAPSAAAGHSCLRLTSAPRWGDSKMALEPTTCGASCSFFRSRRPDGYTGLLLDNASSPRSCCALCVASSRFVGLVLPRLREVAPPASLAGDSVRPATAACPTNESRCGGLRGTCVSTAASQRWQYSLACLIAGPDRLMPAEPDCRPRSDIGHSDVG